MEFHTSKKRIALAVLIIVTMIVVNTTYYLTQTEKKPTSMDTCSATCYSVSDKYSTSIENLYYILTSCLKSCHYYLECKNIPDRYLPSCKK